MFFRLNGGTHVEGQALLFLCAPGLLSLFANAIVTK